MRRATRKPSRSCGCVRGTSSGGWMRFRERHDDLMTEYQVNRRKFHAHVQRRIDLCLEGDRRFQRAPRSPSKPLPPASTGQIGPPSQADYDLVEHVVPRMPALSVQVKADLVSRRTSTVPASHPDSPASTATRHCHATPGEEDGSTFPEVSREVDRTIATPVLFSPPFPDISGKAVRGRQWQAVRRRCRSRSVAVRWQWQCEGEMGRAWARRRAGVRRASSNRGRWPRRSAALVSSSGPRPSAASSTASAAP